MRGTFANVRLRNQLAPGTEGGVTVWDGEQTPIYDAAMQYADEGVPLCVLAGEEYGSGSSRDWAAKGPSLLGVRFVLAESYERIHRSNLVGMGVLPLQFPDGESAESLGLTGEETFDLAPLEDGATTLKVTRRRRGVRRARAHRHAERVALLPPRRDPALRPARPPCARIAGSPTTTSASAAARRTCSASRWRSSPTASALRTAASSSSRTTRARPATRTAGSWPRRSTRR